MSLSFQNRSHVIHHDQSIARALAERLSTDPSNLSKELRRLEREGLFRAEISGRQKYFQLNREYPLFDEVRRIVSKTIGAVAMMRASYSYGLERHGMHFTRVKCWDKRCWPASPGGALKRNQTPRFRRTG